MKKSLTVLICVALLAIGAVAGCFFCGCCNRLAIVDVMAVVNKSSQVEALKNEQVAKTQELAKWLQTVQAEVKNEKSKEKQNELLAKYNTELTQKREEMAKEYSEKLQAIDNDIKQVIIKTAKSKGYKTIVSKSVVIHGGTDITEDVIKAVK